MLQHPAIAELARRIDGERLAAAERRHFLFRHPIAVPPVRVAPVIPLPAADSCASPCEPRVA